MKKLGKAAVSFLLTTVLFSLFTSLLCCADSNTYYIPESAMTIELPDNITAATQGIRENDDLFDKDKGGWDYIQTMSEMRENGDYLLGKSSDNSFKIEVKVSDNSDGIKDLGKLSEKKLNAFYDSIRSQSDVFEVSEKEINSLKYAGVVRNTKIADLSLYSYEYITVLDSKNITVKITSYNDRLTNDENELLKAAVTSIVFSNAGTVHEVPKIGGSLIFSFCVISAGFAALVICKLNAEKVHIIFAKIKAARVHSEVKKEDKQKITEIKQETSVLNSVKLITPQPVIADTESDNDPKMMEPKEIEITSENSDVLENSESDNKDDVSIASDDTKESEEEEEVYEVDLDEAIANFDDSAEARQRRRNERNTAVKKKKRFF